MAVAVWNIAWFMLAFIPFCYSGKHFLNNYELHKLCVKRTVDMEDENVTSGMFKLFNREATYRQDFKCKLIFKAPEKHRVLLRFANADIRPRYRSYCRNHVWIYETEHAGTRHVPSSHNVSLCGDDPPNKTFKSAERVMVIYMEFDDDPLTSDEGYKIFFNAFRTGACKTGEFKCDNGHCIDARLNCNGYNNCGDGSDTCSSLVPILAGASAGVFLLCFSLACLYCCGKKRSKLGEKSDATETTMITSQAADQTSPGYVSMPCPTWEQVSPSKSGMGPCDQLDGHPLVPHPDEASNRPPKYSASDKGYPLQQDGFQSAHLGNQDYNPPPKYSPPAQGYSLHG